MIIALYADGGVIGRNPSTIGGTYAYRILDDKGCVVEQGCRSISPSSMNMGASVTNNQTEMLAILEGIKHLPDDFDGTIYSDSNVTLGRLFRKWKWTNIPEWMKDIFKQETRRLINWKKVQGTLVQGHPTKDELEIGMGHKGYPVSEHNVWCDSACQSIACQCGGHLKPKESRQA